MSRCEFYTRLTESYFLHGNFYCYLDRELDGNIVNLAPFIDGSMYAYARDSRNNADPVRLLAKDSYYYLSQFTEGEGEDKKTRTARYLPEDILHIKSAWRTPDLLNGVGLTQAYQETIDMAQSTLATAQKFADNNMVSPSVISGINEVPANKKTELKTELDKFFNSQSNFLTLDDSIKIDDTLVQQPAQFIQVLSSISTLNLARLLSIPVSLLAREDGANTDSGMSLKESHRFFIKNSGRAYLSMIAEALSELTPEHTFKFLWRNNQFADLRESQALPPLLESKIINESKAKEWLED